MYMNETKRKLGRNAMPCELKKIFNTSKSIIFRKANKRKAKLPPILGASIYLAHSHNTEHTHTTTTWIVGHPALTEPKGPLSQTSNYLDWRQDRRIQVTLSLYHSKGPLSDQPLMVDRPFAVFTVSMSYLCFPGLLLKDVTC